MQGRRGGVPANSGGGLRGPGGERGGLHRGALLAAPHGLGGGRRGGDAEGGARWFQRGRGEVWNQGWMTKSNTVHTIANIPDYQV